MEYCPNCGNKLKKDDKFCPKCGYKLTNDRDADKDKKVIEQSTDNGSKKVATKHKKFDIPAPIVSFFRFKISDIVWGIIFLLFILISFFNLDNSENSRNIMIINSWHVKETVNFFFYFTLFWMATLVIFRLINTLVYKKSFKQFSKDILMHIIRMGSLFIVFWLISVAFLGWGNNKLHSKSFKDTLNKRSAVFDEKIANARGYFDSTGTDWFVVGDDPDNITIYTNDDNEYDSYFGENAKSGDEYYHKPASDWEGENVYFHSYKGNGDDELTIAYDKKSKKAYAQEGNWFSKIGITKNPEDESDLTQQYAIFVSRIDSKADFPTSSKEWKKQGWIQLDLYK